VRMENVPGAEMPRHLPAQDHVHISVRDTGNGIRANICSGSSIPFHDQPQGSGLGLATVHSIVRKHEGMSKQSPKWARARSFTSGCLGHTFRARSELVRR